MKWAVSFPEESILLVRPCLIALCAGNRPAAKLLSVLIYRYSIRQEHKSDAENINEVRATSDQDTTFRIYRKQSQLVTDMCDEITEKTLHDVAVPTLQLLGYLDIDESPAIHCYDLHLDIVAEALEAYKQGPKQLEEFLLSHLQLEKFLIGIQLEKVLINKKNFLLALEKVLIANRNISNNKRGRKPRTEETGEPQSEEPQINIEIDSEIGNREGEPPASFDLKETVRQKLSDPQMRAITEEMLAAEQATYVNDTPSHSYSTHDYGNAEDEDDTPTEKVPIVKIGENDGHSDSPSDSRAFHYRGSTARLAAPPVPTVAGHQERVEAHRANDGAGTHRSLSDAARGQTSFQVEPTVADPPVGTRQAAPGLRITQAPTSRAVTQERMSEPAPPTDKQLKQQQTRREAEIWVRVEAKLETTFSRTQRKSAKNKRGMERLLEDEITDEKIELALDRLTEWEINNFDLERFHELLPGKTAKHRSSQQNGKAPSTASKKNTDVNDYSITALLKRQAAAQG